MGERGEIFQAPGTSIEDFIAEMRVAVLRSSTKAVFGYRSLDDARKSLGTDVLGGSPGAMFDNSVIMVIETMGRLAIDDLYHAPITREGGKTSSPLYELEEPWRWPSDLFGRLVTYTWIIDHPINPLDSLSRV